MTGAQKAEKRRRVNGGKGALAGKPKPDAPVTDVFRASNLLRALRSFKKGDFTTRLPLDYDGVAGEIAEAFNSVVELNERMAEELGRLNTHVAKEGRLRQRASLGTVSGAWLSCVDSVNGLIADLVPPTTIVWTADVNGALVYCNARWADYTGTPIAQAMGWRWLESVHAEDRERCDQEWRQAIAARHVHESKFRLRNREGVYRWHLSRSVPEENRSGEITGWLGTYADCDDLKRAIDSRDEFLLIASHELRTPLSVLQIQMQSLQMILRDGHPESNGRLKGKLDSAVRQTGRLERLIDSLLDVSRITAGRFKLELEEFDLAQAVREVTERFADEAARANCKLEVVTDAVTPGQWDRLRIEQVLVNLLSNAVKYGGGQPVHVTVERSGLGARLTVRDHGIGIAAEHLKRIFDRFERAVSARHYAGLGVGLYITREIVEAHGGRIHARSEPGVGSTFVVDLPCQPAVSAESADGRLPTASARRSRIMRKTSEPAP